MQIETIAQDVRHGLRLLGRERAFTATAVLTLALSTGAASAIFSVIDSALLRPLPYPHPEQLVDVRVGTIVEGELRGGVAPSLDDVRAWSGPRSPLVGVAVERSVFPARVLDAGSPERVESMNVTEEYFSLFDVAPYLGRMFTTADTSPGAPGAILLNYGFWLSRFGGDRTILNRAVRFDGELVTIVGVLPAGFGRAIPVWRALQMPANRQDRRGMGWHVIGRLREGVTMDGARARLTAVLPLQSGAPERDAVAVRSVLDETRGDYRATVTIITSTVALIVLIACVNVAGLLLAKGASRQAELAVRMAMGASRARVIRQILTESLVLSAIGGVAGLGLASVTLNTIVANIPLELPGDAPARISPFVLAATIGIAMLNGVLFGLIPALRLSRTSGSQVMARAGRQQAAGLSRRGGQSLIAVEIALAVVMLAGAALMVRSFIRLVAVDLGFDPASYLTLKVQPLDQKPGSAALYYPALLDKIRQLPDVEAAGGVDYAPLADEFAVTAARRAGGEFEQMIQIQTATPGYFEAIGVRARQGRVFDDADTSGPGVLVISEKAARLFFPNGPAVGQQLQMAGGNTWLDVVGVVPDTLYSGPRDRAGPALYKVLRKSAGVDRQPNRFTVVVRPRPGARDLPNRLWQAAESAGQPVIIDGVRLGSDWFSDRVDVPRQRMVLLSLLGGLGLLLAVVGVLGTTSYAVGRRTQEIGIRLALGARPGRVVRDVLLDSVWPILIGVVTGIGAARLTTKVIQSFLFKTSPTDATTLVLVGVALAAVGCVAAWIPARRAANIDPVTALRSE